MTFIDLFIWRHAEAEDSVFDLARRLTPRGQHDAATVAKALAKHAERAVLIASPATRTRETAAPLSEATGLEVRIDPRLAPGVDLHSVLAVLDETIGATDRDRRSSIILVGHQPWVGQLAHQLLAGDEGDWSVKKAAAWWLSHRDRGDGGEWILRTVFDPDLV